MPITPGHLKSADELIDALGALAGAGCTQAIVREPLLSAEAVEGALPLMKLLMPNLMLHTRCAGVLRVLATTPDERVGVHLPSGCVPFPFYPLAGPVGCSTHTLRQARLCQEGGASYVLLSPAWRPTSKPDDARTPLGPAAMGMAQREVKIPVFALGGVTPRRARELMQCGVYGAAALGHIFQLWPDANSVTRRAAALLRACEGNEPPST